MPCLSSAHTAVGKNPTMNVQIYDTALFTHRGRVREKNEGAVFANGCHSAWGLTLDRRPSRTTVRG